jgi:hypothetical protein
MPTINSTFGEGPRLLEQKVRSAFCGVTPEQGCGAKFKFEPVFYWRHFNGDGRTEACRTIACNVPKNRSTDFDPGVLRIFVNGLCGDVPCAEKQKQQGDLDRRNMNVVYKARSRFQTARK